MSTWPKALLLLLLGLEQVLWASPSREPNIVIILADDLGYGDVGAYHSDGRIPTPHLDRLAEQGLRFLDAHSASGTCTPSRYGLLTGINPARTGVKNTLLKQGGPIISEEEGTIADLLRAQGYRTCMVGKWHLGFDMQMDGARPRFDFSQPLRGGPLDRGFDEFFGIHSSPGAQPYFYIRGREAVVVPSIPTKGIPGKKGNRETWAPGLVAPGYIHQDVAPTFCREAVRIIREHGARGQGKPLFLYYALSSPHAPWFPVETFAGKSPVGSYGDFIMQLDDEVGQVCRALDESGLAENTLLIFTSDNGAMWKPEDEKQFGHRASGPLRGVKSQAFEGGHRIPFLVRWPGQIPAGSVSATTINFTDVYATLVDLFDGKAAGPEPIMRDSHSFLAALRRPDTRYPRPAMVNTPECIRVGDWKLVAKRKGGNPEETAMDDVWLFDLANDLAETSDQINNHPERAAELLQRYQRFLRERSLKGKPTP